MQALTKDERLNRCAEWHGRPVTEAEKQHVLQTMQDDLDGIYPLPKLKREVVTAHLVPRKMTFCEIKQEVVIPAMLAVCFTSLFALLL